MKAASSLHFPVPWSAIKKNPLSSPTRRFRKENHRVFFQPSLGIRPPTGMPGHDYGHPVRVAAHHSSPLAVITPADEESPRIQITSDPLRVDRLTRRPI